jgi:hypothetical protein
MSPLKPSNIASILLTELTFHIDRFPLKKLDYANIAVMPWTFPTFHLEISPLKSLANANMDDMFVTDEVYQVEMLPSDTQNIPNVIVPEETSHLFKSSLKVEVSVLEHPLKMLQ